MRRNCNLELRLFPIYDSDRHHPLVEEGSEISPQHKCHHHHHHQQQEQEQEQERQKLTIFYDGKICVCDVTEYQARAILMLANKEKATTPTATPTSTSTPTGRGSSEPSSPTTLQSGHQLYSPTGISMKRSLQRFLQKRKNRLQEGSPYNQ